MQLQAPQPIPIYSQKYVKFKFLRKKFKTINIKNFKVPNRPSYYGLEYHGMISRQESEKLLGNDDGNFLVRESNNPPSSCTLAIKY